MRVRELRDVVDRFVMLEAARTFQVKAAFSLFNKHTFSIFAVHAICAMFAICLHCCNTLSEVCRFISSLHMNRNTQGQDRPLLFDQAKTLVADLLETEGVGGGYGGSSSSFDAVQVPQFPSEGYISFAAETYLRCTRVSLHLRFTHASSWTQCPLSQRARTLASVHTHPETLYISVVF